MNKTELVREIIARLSESFAVLEKAAKASHAEATHESSKAENKYDTRGLEAAYLARGQSRQAKELLEAIKAYEKLTLKDFAPKDPVDLTALVELDAAGARSNYFVGPKNGGLEIQFQGQEIMVITPDSPLGRELMGKKAGQRWTALLGGSKTTYRLLTVR